MAIDSRESYTGALDLRDPFMRRRRPGVLTWLLPLLASGGSLLASPPAPPISGVVSHLEAPVASALVIFYNLGDTSLTRSRTAADGTFLLASAPVGVYDLIAYKKGFLPALVRLWHQGAREEVSAVHIQLKAKTGTSRGRGATSSVWELRDRLPADVLREITLEDAADSPGPFDRLRLDRLIGGELRTVADMSSGDTSLSRTALGVRGGLPNGWRYDLHGDYAAVSPSSGASDASTSSQTGNAAGLALDVSTSPLDRVRLTTRRHTISLHDDRAASLQTHGVSWSRGSEEGHVESVAARYVEETNLYRSTSAGTSVFPLASRTWEVKGSYARPANDSPGSSVAMSYRRREGTVGPSGVGSDGVFLLSAPDADLSASASVKLSSRAQVEGGVVARYLAGGYGIAPRAAARYDVGNRTYVFVRGLYRVLESGTGSGTVMPLVVSIEENGEAVSSRGLAVGLERRIQDGIAFQVEASSLRVNEAVRAFFEGDFLTDFDSLYLFDGNVIRQYQATGSHRLSGKMSGSVALRYGTIGAGVAPQSVASYGIAANRGYFWSARAAVEVAPTRTGLAVLVRGVRQRLETPAALSANDSDKIAVSVAQDLSVVGLTPFGSACKLLLAIESARSTAKERETPSTSSRLLGGVAIAF